MSSKVAVGGALRIRALGVNPSMHRGWGAWVLGAWLVMAAVTGAGGLGVGRSDAADEQPSADERAERLARAQSHAIQQILASSKSPNAFLRANAIEAMQGLPHRVASLVQLGLDDPHPVVRFAAAATIGKLKLAALIPSAQRLLEDPSESVRAAVLYAMRRCDVSADLSPLAQMLTSTDPTVRGNAAMLLGEMGEPSAVPMLKELARVPLPRASAAQEAIVRIQVAEAVVKLGDESALNAVRSGVYSQFDEVRVLAVSILGELQDRRMEKAYAQLLTEPPVELQLAAAGALAQVGREEGLAVVLEACGSSMPTVRAQAAWTLQYFTDSRAEEALIRMLDDVDEQVRLSAAASVLRRGGAPQG